MIMILFSTFPSHPVVDPKVLVWLIPSRSLLGLIFRHARQHEPPYYIHTPPPALSCELYAAFFSAEFEGLLVLAMAQTSIPILIIATSKY